METEVRRRRLLLTAKPAGVKLNFKLNLQEVKIDPETIYGCNAGSSHSDNGSNISDLGQIQIGFSINQSISQSKHIQKKQHITSLSVFCCSRIYSGN